MHPAPNAVKPGKFDGEALSQLPLQPAGGERHAARQTAQRLVPKPALNLLPAHASSQVLVKNSPLASVIWLVKNSPLAVVIWLVKNSPLAVFI
jgi:hypothetical protein